MQLVIAFLLLGAVLADHHADHAESHNVDNVHEHTKTICNHIHSQHDLDYKALNGKWVVTEMISFKDGHIHEPENDRRSDLCLHGTLSDVTSDGFKIHFLKTKPDGEVHEEHLEAQRISSGDSGHQGRLSFTSDKADRTNWEVLLLDAVPDKYLVQLWCQPPNEDGERLPAHMYLQTRFNDGHEAITEEEKQVLGPKIWKQVHLKEGKPVRLEKGCWA